MRTSRTRTFVLAVIIALLLPVGGQADSIWDYEAVNADGTGSHPLVGADPIPANRVVIEGVTLAGVGELLDPDVMYTAMVQDTASDRGGMQIWAGSFWWEQGWRPVNYPDFNAGDRVRVTGFLGNHNGKVFINDRHSDDPDIIFTLEVIETGVGIPDPAFISSVSSCNYFDQTRAGGGERYQTRFVMLHDVQVVSGTWGNNQQLVISDASGSVNMLLSGRGNFNNTTPPSSAFNVVGIMDQEDPQPPYHDNYRVWVKKYEDIAEALYYCRQVRNKAVGDRVALVDKVVSRAFDGYFYIQDATRVGGIRVVSDRAVEPGDIVCVQGTVTTSDGEIAILPRYTVVEDGDGPAPLLVNSVALRAESGLDVFGMLIRCVGKIGANLGGGLYEFTDDFGRDMRMKVATGVTVPSQGTFVAVTAVASGDSSMPVLLVADSQDIQTLN